LWQTGGSGTVMAGWFLRGQHRAAPVGSYALSQKSACSGDTFSRFVTARLIDKAAPPTIVCACLHSFRRQYRRPPVASIRLEAPRRILTYWLPPLSGPSGIWAWAARELSTPHAPIFSLLIYGAELFGFRHGLGRTYSCAGGLSERQRARRPAPGHQRRCLHPHLQRAGSTWYARRCCRQWRWTYPTSHPGFSTMGRREAMRALGD